VSRITYIIDTFMEYEMFYLVGGIHLSAFLKLYAFYGRPM